MITMWLRSAWKNGASVAASRLGAPSAPTRASTTSNHGVSHLPAHRALQIACAVALHSTAAAQQSAAQGADPPSACRTLPSLGPSKERRVAAASAPIPAASFRPAGTDWLKCIPPSSRVAPHLVSDSLA